MNLNYVVHNTWWVVGHFHLTIGAAIALTFMAATYWFLPQVTGKKLWSKPAGLAQVLLWVLWMTLTSNSMHRQGLIGVPRRTAESQHHGFEFETAIGSMAKLNAQVALDGILLFISALLFLLVVLMTILVEKGRVCPRTATPRPSLIPRTRRSCSMI